MVDEDDGPKEDCDLIMMMRKRMVNMVLKLLLLQLYLTFLCWVISNLQWQIWPNHPNAFCFFFPQNREWNYGKLPNFDKERV